MGMDRRPIAPQNQMPFRDFIHISVDLRNQYFSHNKMRKHLYAGKMESILFVRRVFFIYSFIVGIVLHL